jgi:hypothetical protein
MPNCEVDDSRYGSVLVDYSDEGRTIVVTGETIPPVSLARIGEPTERRADVPIGTRDARHLHLVVDGIDYTLRPSGGRSSRRSYRVRVSGPDSSWLFTPATRRSHRLVRGRRYTRDNEIGLFTVDQGSIGVRWSHDTRGTDAMAHAGDATPLECALGYVLAAGFGTGAHLMVSAIFNGTVDILLPG